MLLMMMLAMAAEAAQPRPAPTQADWITPPTAIDAMKYYPAEAQKNGVSGSAVIECTLQVSGDLRNCQLASETPAGWGFGEAALAAAPQLKARPYSINGVPYEGSLKTPIVFRFPETPVIAPVTMPAADSLAGSAAINCRVAADLRFEACTLLSATPEALGPAALRAADQLRAPSSLAAGARIEIPLNFSATAQIFGGAPQ
jgi:TonB family protein